MFAKYSQILLFCLLCNFINCQNNSSNTTESNRTALINQYRNTCMITPMAFDLLSSEQPDCRTLQKFNSTENDFYCCEVEFQEKKNSSAPRRRGCWGILTNYIDNDRYEDMIDYLKRGKLDKLQQYSIFLGRNASAQFANFITNNTKHNVYKFDCFSKYISIKYYMIFALLYLLFGTF